MDRSRLAFVLLTALAFVVAGCTGRDGEPQPLSANGLLDSTEYVASDLSSYGVKWSRSLSTFDADVATGDLIGDSEVEIAVRASGRVLILSAAGDELESFDLPEGSFALDLIGDADSDGKDDLILGGRREGAGRILVAKADGTVARDAAFVPMFEGRTQAVALREGLLYFHAASRVRVAPKIVGVYDIAMDETRWVHHMGPVPMHLSVSLDGARMAVSNLAVSRDRDESSIPVPYESAHDYHVLLVLDEDGQPVLSTPFGPQATDGAIAEGSMAGAEVQLISSTDGEAMLLLVAEQRLGELYGGATALALYDLSGNPVARYEGDPESRVHLGTYREADEISIVATFDSTGLVVRLDENLAELHRATLPGDLHNARLLSMGDYDGADGIDFLVSDENRLHVLSGDLTITRSFGFRDTVIDAAAFAGSDGRARFVVLAGDVHLLGPGSDAEASVALYSRPPGATYTVDGAGIDPETLPLVSGLSPGTARITARVGNRTLEETLILDSGDYREITFRFDVGAEAGAPESMAAGGDGMRVPMDYAALRRRSSVTVPDDAGFLGIADLLSRPGQELVLWSQAAGKIMVYDGNLRLAASFAGEPAPQLRFAFADVDGDGYQDLLRTYHQDPSALFAYNGEGRRILHKRLFYGNDAHASLGPEPWFDGRLIVQFATSFLRGPDALLALSPPEYGIDFLYPMPAQANMHIEHDGGLYVSMYTFSNGNSVTYPDGTTAGDSQLFATVIATDGTKHPLARPIGLDPAHGRIDPFLFEAAGAGRPEIYYGLGRDPNYYPGPSGIFRLDEDGSLTQVYRGPDDDTGHIIVTDTAAGPRIFISYLFSDSNVILDDAFELVAARDIPEVSLTDAADRDGDGVVEVTRYSGSPTVVETFEGRQLFAPEVGPSAILRFEDIDRDGATEALVVQPGRLEIWGQ